MARRSMTKRDKELFDAIVERWAHAEEINFGRVMAICWMADMQIEPDASFSDAECCLWAEVVRNRNTLECLKELV